MADRDASFRVGGDLRAMGRVAIVVAALLWSWATPAADNVRTVAVAADLSLTDGRTRLALTISGPVDASAFMLEGPDRVVVELGDLNLQLPAGAGTRGLGAVAAFRAGAVASGRSRLVVDLAHPALVHRLAVLDEAPGPLRLVLDLARTDRDAFRRAAAEPGTLDPPTTGSVTKTGPAGDARPLVAVDAGHGGPDSGAVATNGALEKDIVLAFAQALRESLEASGRLRVVMIRDRDVFVPLDERVARAREAGADLFISIHADSMSLASTRGATLYTGSERATDSESARLADRENAADAAAGLPARAPPAGLSDILHDLTVRETRGFSHRFAHLLLADLSPVMRFTVQPHREAGFRVLRAHDMPSILVELGYLSNTRDADLLASEAFRERTGAAMAGAVERFFGSRVGRRAAVSP